MGRFEGIWNATAKKRYKHFINYVADEGSVWLLSNREGFTTIDIDGFIHLLVWPMKEFALAFDDTESPVEVEIHDFCDRCEELLEQENVRFMVFPTNKDTFVVETSKLLDDIIEQLDLIE